MSLVVEFRISGDPIELTAVPEAVPEATFEVQRWCHFDDRVLWYLWVYGGDRERVTEAFESLSHVVDVTVLSDTGSTYLYSVEIVPKVDSPPPDLLAKGTITSGYLEANCLRLTGHVTCRDAITGTWHYLRQNGMNVTVDRLKMASDEKDNGQLTDPQFEALATAYEMGYFDDDIKVTHEEIADELGISRSSLSSRLRRAERQLVRSQLE